MTFTDFHTFTTNRDSRYCQGDGILHLKGTTSYAQRNNDNVVDLDYSQDFSIEVGLLVQPYSYSTVWAPVLRKSSTIHSSNSGWGEGFYQGRVSVGKNLAFRIGDDTNSVALSTSTSLYGNDANFVGLRHTVFTWDSNSKCLTSYRDGVIGSSGVNTNIDLEKLSNTSPLIIGTINTDVMVARMWQRKLEHSEISDLSNNFSNGLNITPSGFDRSNLHSEWLMLETCDASGNFGTTHIKDNVGENHLELFGDATILKADGNLSLLYPTNGEVDVNPASFIEASGGYLDLISPTLPTQYFFQLDTVDTFDSNNLRESDWVPRYAMWRPILKPDTTYYTRVKCGDSSDVKQESSYTNTVSFTTRSPKNWYVRPGEYTGSKYSFPLDRPIPISGLYGNQDGSSYEDAWNGLTSVVWGANGVQAGDDLLICGTHVAKPNGSFTNEQFDCFVEEQGYSMDYPLTIRMDHRDRGALLSCLKSTSTFTGPDENGVWFTTYYTTSGWSAGYSNVVVEETQPRTFRHLVPTSGTTWIDNNGYYSVTASGTYLKPYYNEDPNGRMYNVGIGFSFCRVWQSYLKYYKCNFIDAQLGPLDIDSTNLPYASGNVWDSCTFKYVIDDVAISFGLNNHNCVARNCDISYAKNGVYLSSTKNNCTVEYNTIHDIGAHPFNGNSDNHAIGIQCGSGHLIQYNYIYNTGGGIELWSGGNNTSDTTIRYNYIKNSARGFNTNDGGMGCGIYLAGGAGAGKWDGVKIYGNILVNTAAEWNKSYGGYGIGAYCRENETCEVYNNIVYNTKSNGLISSVTNSNNNARFYNNIIVDNKALNYISYSASIHMSGGAVYNNIVYSSSGTVPSISISPTGQGDVYNNENIDPKFVNSSPINMEDFVLQEDSPAWVLGWERIPIEKIGNKYNYTVKCINNRFLINKI